MSEERSSRYAPVPGTWSHRMGIHFLRATADEVVAEIEIGPQHLQGLGFVHGGVYSTLIETTASLGATLAARRHRATVVGLDNHTSFVRVTRDGRLRVVARPLHLGRTTQVWESNVHDGRDRLVATGRVRLLHTAGPSDAVK